MDKKIVLGNLMILGDSYSTFEGWIPEGFEAHYCPVGGHETDVRRVEDTWWHRVVSQTDCNLVLNSSWSGATICHYGYAGRDSIYKSFITTFDKLIDTGFFLTHTVDTLLVFGGTNDTWADSPIGEPKWENWEQEDLYSVAPACGYLAHRIRQVLPAARVCFILNSGLKPQVEESIRQAAQHCGAEVIALTEMDKFDDHPTIVGMEQIANQVILYFENHIRR